MFLFDAFFVSPSFQEFLWNVVLQTVTAVFSLTCSWMIFVSLPWIAECMSFRGPVPEVPTICSIFGLSFECRKRHLCIFGSDLFSDSLVPVEPTSFSAHSGRGSNKSTRSEDWHARNMSYKKRDQIKTRDHDDKAHPSVPSPVVGLDDASLDIDDFTRFCTVSCNGAEYTCSKTKPTRSSGSTRAVKKKRSSSRKAHVSGSSYYSANSSTEEIYYAHSTSTSLEAVTSLAVFSLGYLHYLGGLYVFFAYSALFAVYNFFIRTTMLTVEEPYRGIWHTDYDWFDIFLSTVIIFCFYLFVQFFFFLLDYLTTKKTAVAVSRRFEHFDKEKFALKLENAVKTALAVDWSDNKKVAFGLLSIFQTFNSDLSVIKLVQLIIAETTAHEDFAAHSGEVLELLQCVKAQTEFSAHSFSAHSGVADYRAVWNRLRGSDMSKGMFQLAGILVACEFLPDVNLEMKGLKVFSLKSANDACTAVDLMEALESVFVSACRGAEIYSKTGSFEGFFSAESLESRAAFALSMYQQVMSGNLETFVSGSLVFDNDGKPMSVEDYNDLLETLRKELISAMSMSSKDKSFYRAYLDRITEVQSSVSQIQLAQKDQLSAYGILLFGGTNVGKSYCTTGLVTFLLSLNKFPSDKVNTIVYNPNSKFDDQVRNNTTGVILDDLANSLPKNSQMRPTSEIVIAMINTVAQAAIKADVTEKGKVLMSPKVVVGTTNNRYLNTTHETTSPASVLRRFVLHIEMVVKEPYRQDGSKMLDTNKIPSDAGMYPDLWEITVQRFADENVNIEQAFTWVKSPSGTKVFTMFELVQLLASDSARHFGKERTGLLRRSDVESFKACQVCYLPNALCKCKKVVVVPELKAHAGEIQRGFGQTEFSMEEVETILAQNPNIADILRTSQSFKHWVLFHTIPPLARSLWVRTGASPKNFFFSFCMTLMIIPYTLLFLGFPFVSSASLMFIIWLAKDISYLLTIETIVASSASNVSVRMFRSFYRHGFMSTLLIRATLVGAGLLVAKRLLALMTLTINSHSFDAADSEEAKSKLGFFSRWDVWRGPTGNSGSSDRNRTSTTEQLSNIVVKNTAMVRHGSKTSNGFFITNKILVVPNHFVKQAPKEGCMWNIRYNGKTFDKYLSFQECEIKNFHVDEERDLVFLNLTGMNFARDLVERFMVYERGDQFHAMVSAYDSLGEMAKYTVSSPNLTELSYACTGYSQKNRVYKAKYFPPIGPGTCCAPVIIDGPQPEILGFHIAGNNNTGLFIPITQSYLKETLERLDESGFPVVSSEEAYVAHMDSVTGTDFHSKDPTNLLSEGFHGERLGTIPGTGPRQMKIKRTPYNSDVQKLFDIEDPYGVPSGRAFVDPEGVLHSPWLNGLQEIDAAEDSIPMHLISRAFTQISTEYCRNLDQHRRAGGTVRPLTYDEAINGISEQRGVDGVKMSTSAGHRYKGKKRKHLVKLDHPYVFSERVMTDVSTFDASIRRGIRYQNSLVANLKDEALKLSKCDDRTRIFFCDELSTVILMNKYFSPVMSYMMNNPFTVSTAIGLNAGGYDWQKVWNFLTEYNDPSQGIILDFKAFDKSLPESVTKAAWLVLIRIAESMEEYSDIDIRAMKVLMEEKTLPFIHWNGTLINLCATHTSGNSVTAHVGSTIGKILMYVAFYEIEGDIVDPFDYIRSIHLGDDMMSVVKDTPSGNFNFLSIQRILAGYGIHITMPDKTSEPTPYQDIREHDFLKRNFKRSEAANCLVGVLAEKSLYKSLLWFLPSSEVTNKQQHESSMDSALHEAFLHGPTFYAEFVEKLSVICSDHNLNPSTLNTSFATLQERWLIDQARANPDAPFAIEMHFVDAEESFVAHSATLSIDSVNLSIVCCKGCKCRRAPEEDENDVTADKEIEPGPDSPPAQTVDKNRNAEEGSENSMSSIESGRDVEANTLVNVENDADLFHSSREDLSPSFTSGTSQRRKWFGTLCIISIVFLWNNPVGAHLIRSTDSKWITENSVNFNIEQGWENSQATQAEQTVNAAVQSGMELGNFLSRPVKIAELTWRDTGFDRSELNPWVCFVMEPTVSRKLTNYKLLRGDLSLTFVMNGSPYLYGKAIVTYFPLHGYDNFKTPIARENLTRISQRQSIYFDPTTSEGGNMTLPFFWPYDAVSIPEKESELLGSLGFLPVSNLTHNANIPCKCSITVFANMVNWKLSQPTSSLYVAHSGETDLKISDKLNTAAKAAGSLSKIPVIGPYATATQKVAQTLGAAASLFGYSKPIGTTELTEMRPRFTGSLAPVNDKDSSRLLTLDANNETTVDPRVVGLPSADEMTFEDICSNECILDSTIWNVNDGSDKELARFPVTPFIRSGYKSGTPMHLPPCAYLAMYFEHWRGTMEYRVMVNCSRFHRGKLRLRYEPQQPANSQDYNVVESEVFDISLTRDQKVAVGWGADRNFLKVLHSGTRPVIMGDSANLSSHNGNFIVSVANDLVVPDGALDYIEIVFLVSMKNVEFAVPTDTIFNRTKIKADIEDGEPFIELPPSEFEVSIRNETGDIGAIYYGWYSNDFNAGSPYIRKALEPAQQPVVEGVGVGEYNDTTYNVTLSQASQMKGCGINFVMCFWNGQGSVCDVQLRDEMKARASSDLKYCVMYDTSILRTNGSYEWTSNASLKFESDMQYLKTNYCADSHYYKKNHPHYLVNNIACPVVYLYLLRAWGDDAKASMMAIARNTFNSSQVGTFTNEAYLVGDLMFGEPKAFPVSVTRLLAGIGSYDVYGQLSSTNNEVSDTDIINLHSNFERWRSANHLLDPWPVISPGFNDRASGDRSFRAPLSRKLDKYTEGSLFASQLKHADGISLSGQGCLLVNSWNQWHEDTQIEPCVGTSGTVDTSLPESITDGIVYEPYNYRYTDMLGKYSVPNYVAHSADREVENQHEPEKTSTIFLGPRPSPDDEKHTIFFGERIASLRAMIKRYTLYLYESFANDQHLEVSMGQYPRYAWDNTNPELYETIYSRLACLFHGVRGSTRWKILDNKTSTRTRCSVTLTDSGLYQFGKNSSNKKIGAPTGWAGAIIEYPNLSGAVEYSVPYYQDRRFVYSRSLDYTVQRGQMVSKYAETGSDVVFYVAGGDDLQFHYYADTPEVYFI